MSGRGVRRLARGATALAALAAVACSGGDKGAKEARSLAKLAVSGDEVRYKASYAYVISGPLAQAIRTTIEVVQAPPNFSRRVQTQMTTTEGDKTAVNRWSIRRGSRFYTCHDVDGEVACLRTPESAEIYGHDQIDEPALAARDPAGFKTVRRAGGATIAGQKATCYTAEPLPEPAPVVTSPQPRFIPTRFELELCYARDGIPLRIRRKVLGPVPSNVSGTESLLEATSVRRGASRSDVVLPGPVREARALLRTPSPTPRGAKKGT